MHSFLKFLGLGALAAGLTVGGLTHAAEPLKIGMSISSTGNYALASQAGERGVGIWLDDVNSRGGVTIGGVKRKVELVKLDDRSDKQQVARVYESLIEEHKVDAVIAPFGSTLTGVAATATQRLDKFMVIWSAASESVYNQGFDRIVSATQMPVSVMPVAGVEAAASLGAGKVAIFYVDEPFPAGLATSARDFAKEKGMEVVMFEKYAKGTKDFSIMVEKASALGADFLFPTGYEADQIAILRQMKELDINFPFNFMTYGSQPQFLQIGDDANYVFSHTNFHPAVNWNVNAGLNREQFLAAYDRLFPDVKFAPDFQTALAYGAAVVLEKTLETAGSTDAKKLKQAALSLNDKLTVLAGPYKIDERGRQIGMRFVIVQNQGGKVEAVYPNNVATKKPVYPIPAWASR